MEKYFGKYRGQVTNNLDPLKLARIQVSVPSVLGDGKMSWAMPCVPYAGPGVGFFVLPPVKGNIWVEFEGGDLDYPIWSGCFWGQNELPPKAATEQTKIFQTKSVTLTFSDIPGAGGATLEVGSPGSTTPSTLLLNSAGVKVDCKPASIEMTKKSVKVGISQSTVELKAQEIKAASGASSVTVSSSKLELTNGSAKIQLSGPKVDINSGAAEII